MAGIGGGALMVPFLYLVYSGSGGSLSAQTVVAHATSLGVAFVAASFGTWRYARHDAIAWRPAAYFAVPGIFSAFIVARVVTRTGEADWLRAAFAGFLVLSALDMARRAHTHTDDEEEHPHPQHSWGWLGLTGLGAGAMSALLGIGGGLIAVPVLLYIGKLPVRLVAPTALAGVCLTTFAGGLAYLTAGQGPAISPLMAGYLDLRMFLPLAVGAALAVPVGVRMNRNSRPPTLYWTFAAVFAGIAASILWSWARSGT